MNAKTIILRKCIICNKIMPKTKLIRIVRDQNNNIFVDRTGKKDGRGAYVEPTLKVLEILKKSQLLQKALKVKIGADFFQALEAEIKQNWD